MGRAPPGQKSFWTSTMINASLFRNIVSIFAIIHLHYHNTLRISNFDFRISNIDLCLLGRDESRLYPPSQRAANSSWRMNAERVSSKAVLAMRRIATFIANMISAGGCASAGFAEDGALVPPISVGGGPLMTSIRVLPDTSRNKT